MATLPAPAAPTTATTADDSFSSKKGEVQKCPMCNNALLPPPSRLHCRWCLSSGYVALCLVCKGTGREVAIAAWDGKSQHGSTCNTCGGLKFIPSRLSEFEKWQQDHPLQTQVEGEEKREEEMKSKPEGGGDPTLPAGKKGPSDKKDKEDKGQDQAPSSAVAGAK